MELKDMANYRVTITRIYSAEILVDAESKREAYEKCTYFEKNEAIREMIDTQIMEQNDWDDEEIVVHDNDNLIDNMLINALERKQTKLP